MIFFFFWLILNVALKFNMNFGQTIQIKKCVGGVDGIHENLLKTGRDDIIWSLEIETSHRRVQFLQLQEGYFIDYFLPV